MSNWTHVAAIFRIDSFGCEQNFTEIFGRELNFHDGSAIWDEAEKNPESFLPCGSEGSLQMSVWVNPDVHCIAAYTVSIFGDLRDHDSIDEILNWFDEKCNAVWIRQAVITVENERYGMKTKTYGEERHKWASVSTQRTITVPVCTILARKNF